MSIQFNSVYKAFGPKEILTDFSFEATKGEILFIIGKSGVGKSVTLKHIVGVLEPDQGSVQVDSDKVDPANEEKMAEIRLRCGMVFQQPALLDSLNVFENVAFGLRTPQYSRYRGALTEEQIRTRVEEKVRLVNLEHSVLGKKPQDISYGMQKRVSLARTLAPEPDYLLFDEPTTGLDPITTTAVNDLIRNLSRTLNVTSLVVSHDMGCALEISDRILVLDQGKILELSTVEEIKKSKAPLVQSFLSEVLESGGRP